MSWGSVNAGGYTIIGNLVIINVRIVTNTALSASQSYLISGFPTPVSAPSNYISAFCSLVSSTLFAFISPSGQFNFTPNATITSGTSVVLSAFYIKQ